VFERAVALLVSRPLDEVFSFVEDARNRPRWDESVESDGTWVEFSVTGRPAGPLRLLQPVIARVIQRNLDRGFPRLKRLLETGTAS
jgi:hypothetical protein